MQLFETFQVRFGVMLVGSTNSGKTVTFEILKHAMTFLRKNVNNNNSKNIPDSKF
jgi:dynein heavy chain